MAQYQTKYIFLNNWKPRHYHHQKPSDWLGNTPSYISFISRYYHYCQHSATINTRDREGLTTITELNATIVLITNVYTHRKDNYTFCIFKLVF